MHPFSYHSLIGDEDYIAHIVERVCRSMVLHRISSAVVRSTCILRAHIGRT